MTLGHKTQLLFSVAYLKCLCGEQSCAAFYQRHKPCCSIRNSVQSGYRKETFIKLPENAIQRRGKRMPEIRHFDDVLRAICEFGRWQKFLYFTSCFLVIVPSGVQIATIMFATGTPNFHCVTPNVTCEDNKCCENCLDYSFDGPFTSAVSEWNLICARSHVGAVVQMMFVAGMMAGSLVFGIMSDIFGRRFCLFLCCALTVGCSLGSSFVDCLSFFTFLRFCAGAAVNGLFVAHYVYILELVGPNYRTLAGKVQDVFWVIGASVVVLAAFLIRDWRYLLLFGSLPPGFLFVLWRVFPESVRWLMTNGKFQRAQEILMTYAKKSSANVDKETICEMLEQCKRFEVEGEIHHSPLDLIRTWRMLKRTVILCFNWMVLSLVFYGIMLYIPRLDGNMYLNFFVMFLTDLLHTPLAWFVFKKFGRRIPHCVFMCISGLSLLFVLAIPDTKDKKGIATALAFIGRFFGSASFSNIYLYSSELYPTVIRNLALGTCSTSSRIGGIIAPFIVMLAQLPNVPDTIPLVILGVLTLMASFLSLGLPETLFSNMHQTVEEVQKARENYGIVWMEKPRPCPIPCFRCDSPEYPEEPWNRYPLTTTITEDGHNADP